MAKEFDRGVLWAIFTNSIFKEAAVLVLVYISQNLAIIPI